MGMNLNELIAECESEATKTEALREEIKEKKDALRANICNNFNLFIVPLADTALKFYNKMNDIFHHEPLRDHLSPKFCFYSDDKYRCYINPNCECYMEYVDKVYDNGEKHYDSLHFEECSIRYHSLCMKEFKVEDTAIKVADKLREAFATRVSEIIEAFKVKNTRMADHLEKLKAELEQSSTVEQVSENTVRVQIGGKTYIGTLEEN